MNMRVAFAVTLVVAVVAVCVAAWMAWDLVKGADPVRSQLRGYVVGGVR